jgi:hypothetical protein
LNKKGVKMKKKVLFYIDNDVNERLSRMCKLIGEPKSVFVNDVLDDVTKSFFKIINNGKNYSGVFKLLGDKFRELGEELKEVEK